MNDLLARELARVLKKNGIESDVNIEGATEIQLNIEQIATISPSGALRYPLLKNEDLDLKQVVEKLAPILAEVREYTYLLEKASNVQSGSGNGDYELHPDQEQIITQTCNQIQGALPNLLENITNSEQKLREWRNQEQQQSRPTFNMEQSI